MKSFMPMPRRMIYRRCPYCGKEEMTAEKSPLWIYTCLTFFSAKSVPPICPECKKKMIKTKLLY